MSHESNAQQLCSRKRGRPKANGFRSLRLVRRESWILYFYGQAREAGAKHTAAVAEAVSEARRRWPKMRISATKVKRILAEYQPSGYPLVWIVTLKSEDEISRDFERCQQLKLRGAFASRPRYILSVGLGPRPAYPRINARYQRAPSDGGKTHKA